MIMKNLFYILLFSLCTVSCFDIPDEGTISPNMSFSQKVVDVRLGRQHVIGESYGLTITVAGTTFPFQFEVERVTRLDDNGQKVEDCTEAFKKEVPIKIWKESFTKKEKNYAEFDAKRVAGQQAVLLFTKANEMVFNYGHAGIKPGKYMLDLKVVNTSGSLVFPDMMTLNVQEEKPYNYQAYNVTAGTDNIQKCTVDFKKNGTAKESLTVRIIEKDGTSVNIDSLEFASDYYNPKKNMFYFKQENTAGTTTFDLPYPAPFATSNVTMTESRIIQYFRASRYGIFMEMQDKKDDKGNVIKDPITGEPVKELQPVKKVRYGMMFAFAIFEPGEWEMTVRVE